MEETEEKTGPKKFRILGEIKDIWPFLTFYERFEQIVAIFLTFLISGIILTALWGLGIKTVSLIHEGALNNLGNPAYQEIFGIVLTVLIAMEFNHSLFHSVIHRGQIIKVKTIILIAILAIARKFIVIQAEKTNQLNILSYSAAVLALGIVYWLMDSRERNKSVWVGKVPKEERH